MCDYKYNYLQVIYEFGKCIVVSCYQVIFELMTGSRVTFNFYNCISILTLT